MIGHPVVRWLFIARDIIHLPTTIMKARVITGGIIIGMIGNLDIIATTVIMGITVGKAVTTTEDIGDK
jgi:hypothetical protein